MITALIFPNSVSLQSKNMTNRKYYLPKIHIHHDPAINTDHKPQSIKHLYINPADDLKHKMVFSKEIVSKLKPPHRYKTSMVASSNSLVLFGGLGCEKKLSWAHFDFNSGEWTFPTIPQAIVPIYGHSMVNYHHHAFIYGGMHRDVSNELAILDLNHKKITTGKRAPFRRRDHACTILSRFMVVHGGVEINQEVRNEMFYYCVKTNHWEVFSCNKSLPYLSNHQMVTYFPKQYKKVKRVGDLMNAGFYMFGGRDPTGQPQNKLYKLNILAENQIDIVEIQAKHAPQPRYGFAMQNTGTGFIMVYGGKQNEEQSSVDRVQGVFNDLHLFNIEKEIWVRPEVTNHLQPRFGMASAVYGQKVYIFGGCGIHKYANANILVLRLNEIGQFLTMKDIQDEQDKQNIDRKSSKLNLIPYFK